jgi:hydroxyethylthiazole kinase
MAKGRIKEAIVPAPGDLGVWAAVERVRSQSPLVHNITNFVVMNNTANGLLALGAAPVMAHAEEEMADIVAIASALVINIGTLSKGWVPAMFLAAEHAAKRGLPIILDPVGAGASAYRTQTVLDLLKAVKPTIIRGNASEIMAIQGAGGATRGVDSSHGSGDALEAARALHAELGSVICISGAVDCIVGDRGIGMIRNGHPLMTRVTGLGCTASALCGALAAVTPDPWQAAAQTMAIMGVAGEIAADRAEGPGSLQLQFLDALYNLTEKQFAKRLRYEVQA